MSRKVLILVGSAILVAASITAVPASAATKISNGVPCSKNNATTKVNGKTYKCAKNPLKKNAKLTWLSSTCVTTGNGYLKAVSGLAKDRAKNDPKITKFKETLVKLKVAVEQLTILEAKEKDYTTSIKTLEADTANLTKNASAIISLKTDLIKTKTDLVSLRSTAKNIKIIESSTASLVAGLEDGVANVKTNRNFAKKACKKGR